MTVTTLNAYSDKYIWVLSDSQAGQFDCVDPGEAQPVLDYIQKSGLSLRAILLTHHHFDHIGGVAELLKQHPDITVYGPKDYRIPFVNRPVKDKETITIGPNSFQILYTPGHTSTHVSYLESKKNWLFCGDTLFSAGCGRIFDGTPDELYQSLQIFKNLPDNTLVYCAHEYTLNNLKFALTIEPNNSAMKNYQNKLIQQNTCTLPSTIGLEKEINPFLRTDTSALKEHAKNHGVDPNNNVAVFTLIRKQKDNF